MLDIIKSIFFGIVEGITEWLPVSSTGHMILFDEFVHLCKDDPDFMNMYLVVIQLGAIMAVVLLYWNKLWPFNFKNKGLAIIKPGAIPMWSKILISCIPAAVVGVLWDDELEALFYNWWTVAITLAVVGAMFIFIENRNKSRTPDVNSIGQISYKAAVIIGLFQVIAAVFPGTSRSGATIIGALLIGLSRKTAAEYTFFLAVPVMFGASLLKLLSFGFNFTLLQFAILIIGMLVSFVVSVVVIKFLMGYIKKHDFKAFGWYRIVLGCIVLIYFAVKSAIGA